jgi:hypothetical protein
MATLNFGSFFDGYAKQQDIELRDAEDERRRVAERQRAELFEQGQRLFNQDAPLRDLQRDVALTTLQGQQVVLPLKQQRDLARARFNLAADDATLAAQYPTLTTVAQAGAQAQLDAARAAALQGNTSLLQAGARNTLHQTPGFLDEVIAAQRNAATAGALTSDVAVQQARLEQGLYQSPEFLQDATATRRNTAAAGAAGSALKALLARDELALQQDPVARGLVQTANQMQQQATLLDGALRLRRMDVVNNFLASQGLEAKFEGATPMIRQRGAPEGTPWEPWTNAMSLPFFQDLTRNLEMAARAHAKEASVPQAAPASPVAGLFAAPTEATPVAGRPAPSGAPPQGAAATPARPAAPAENPQVVRARSAYQQALRELAGVPGARHEDVVRRAQQIMATPALVEEAPAVQEMFGGALR